MAPQGIGNSLYLCFVEIRCDLQRQRDMAAMLLGEDFLFSFEGGEQAVQFGSTLQLAQVLGIGRGDVHGHVTGVGVHLAQAGQVVVNGALDWRVEVLADVDAKYALVG